MISNNQGHNIPNSPTSAQIYIPKDPNPPKVDINELVERAKELVTKIEDEEEMKRMEEEKKQKESRNTVPRLSKTTLRIPTDDSWIEEEKDRVKTITNGKGVWEYLKDAPNGEKIKGEQIFTQQAAIDAAKDQWKTIPSKEQLGQIIKSINPNIDLNGGWQQDDNTVPSIRETLGVKLAGYRSTINGEFYNQGDYGYLRLSDPGCYVEFDGTRVCLGGKEGPGHAFSVLYLE